MHTCALCTKYNCRKTQLTERTHQVYNYINIKNLECHWAEINLCGVMNINVCHKATQSLNSIYPIQLRYMSYKKK